MYWDLWNVSLELFIIIIISSSGSSITILI